MPNIAYINGQFAHRHLASTSIEDRGYQFADGVYEVIAFYEQTLVDKPQHLDRLEYSLSELQIPLKPSRKTIEILIQETIRRNRINNGFIYLQITRGVAKRNHEFPKHPITPCITITANQLPGLKQKKIKSGQRVITTKDIRWQRCDIKSIALLPNILAKQAAIETGAIEAIQINQEGFITEGSASNISIITFDNRLITHPANQHILSGITRNSILELAKSHNLTIEERHFTLEEAKNAAEIFISSTTKDILPITQIDDHTIANGAVGERTQTLYNLYIDYIKQQIEP